MARLVFIFALATLCCAELSRPQQDQRTPLCPNPEQIMPCVCTVEGLEMDLDCTAVESENQLGQIFSKDFPSPNFRELKMFGNRHVKLLNGTTFGTATFKILNIVYGVLEEVLDSTFSRSYSTLTHLSHYNNRVRTFPFRELSAFSSLATLGLAQNSFTAFPQITSSSLRELYLHNNHIKEIPRYRFHTLPNLQYVNFHYNEIKEIFSGTFSGLKDLYFVSLENNNLTHIPGGAFQFNGTRGVTVYLKENGIKSVAAGGVSGMKNGILGLSDNSLVVFEEEVFRPILEGGAHIRIDGNPLLCGCDIAWLITNPAFMSQTSHNSPTCSDGFLLSDLDPDTVKHMC